MTLADLYLGCGPGAGLIIMFERRPLMAAAWIVQISLLGNVWTVIWFIV